MNSQEKATELILELTDPGDRRTRTERLGQTLQAALTLMDADGAAIVIPSGEPAERLVLHAGSAVAASLPLPAEHSQVVRRLAESCRPLALPDISADLPIAAADGCPGVDAGPALFMPVRSRDPVPGYVAVYRRRGRARFTLSDTRTMLLLGAWLGATLDNLRLATGAQKLSVTDPVTNVYNTRYFRAALRREVRRAGRFGQELSLVMLELDPVEPGEAIGDERRGRLLRKEVASVLAQEVRSFDVLATHGGERFVMILPQTGRAGAIEVAERMRVAVEGRAFPEAPAGTVTLSAGVASFPHDAASVRDLIAAAERALEQSRERGGNRVVALAPPGDSGSRLAPLTRSPAKLGLTRPTGTTR